MDYTVEYYEKDDGSRPAEEFILSQDNKMQAPPYASHIQRCWMTGFLKCVQSKVQISAGCFTFSWWDAE